MLFLNKNLMKNDKIYKGYCSGINFKRKKIVINYYSVLFFLKDWLFYLIKML